MSVSSARGERKFGLRDRRQPGHYWADNEIFDVFGDQLGMVGIHLYNTMARLCWDTEVRSSLREIAAHARMGKSTVDRTMKLLVAIGLIEEECGPKEKTASVYRIVNAKQLAAHFVAARLQAATAPPPVPVGDSAPSAPDTPNPNPLNTKTSVAMPTLVQLLCPARGQSAEQPEAADKKICPPDSGTDLSHTDANLSHTDAPFNHQDSRPQEPVQPPTPFQGGGAEGIEGEVYAATKRVMEECTLSDPRLTKVIVKAMAQAMAANGKTAGEVAATMIRNHADYVAAGPKLRFTWGPRRFFAEGHWLNWRGWPIDRKLEAESRRL